MSPDYSWQHIAASYLFLPYANPRDGSTLPLLPLGWTLNYEMFFYGVFALALVLSRFTAIAAISVLFVTMAIAGALLPLPQPLRFWADPQILEFVYGMWLAEAYLRGFRLPRPAAVLALVAGMGGAMLYEPGISSSALPRGIAWGLPAAAVFAGVVLSKPWKAGSSGILHALGAASYSLPHPPRSVHLHGPVLHEARAARLLPAAAHGRALAPGSRSRRRCHLRLLRAAGHPFPPAADRESTGGLAHTADAGAPVSPS